jgi:cob(I)alamin adenosyltransferase
VNYAFEQVVTKNGDRGTSTNYDGISFRKDDFLFEVLGDLDELSSWIGRIKHYRYSYCTRHIFEDIQMKLQHGGSLVATEPNLSAYGDIRSETYQKLYQISQKDIDVLESLIKKHVDSKVEIVNGFVLPGDNDKSADVDIARTVCRRTERQLVRYMGVNSDRLDGKSRFDLKWLSIYLNRLSDFLFILARSLEQ